MLLDYLPLFEDAVAQEVVASMGGGGSEAPAIRLRDTRNDALSWAWVDGSIDTDVLLAVLERR